MMGQVRMLEMSTKSRRSVSLFDSDFDCYVQSDLVLNLLTEVHVGSARI